MNSRVPARLRSALAVIAVSGLLVTCRLGDLVTTPPLPVLNISVERLEDSAAVGSVALRTMTADVANTGEGELTWTVRSAGGSAWLGFSDSSGGVPATITASFDPGGLPGGVGATETDRGRALRRGEVLRGCEKV